MKRILMVATLSALAGCGGGQGGVATSAMPPIQERTYQIKDQAQETAYVPVLRLENPAWKARIEDTLGPVQTLDACKQALKERAAKPRTGESKGYQVTEHVCYEVKKSGGQRKIVVGQG
jgi:hypothetical protein